MKIISRPATSILLAATLLPCVIPMFVQASDGATVRVRKVTGNETERLENVATILNELMAARDNAIPKELIDNAAALILIPSVKKGAFIFGGEFGRGVVIVRQKNGSWGSPGFVTLKGGSFGFQAGGETTDLVLVVKNRSGIQKLSKNHFKLGADASVAAGPVGRSASANTDAQMKAKILAYSRSQGLFAGISLEGGTIKLDDDANMAVYGRKLNGKDVLESRFQRTDASNNLYVALGNTQK